MELVFSECRRVLLPGGVLVITHPAKWTDALLRMMARVGLVSRAEIDDHKSSYGRAQVIALLQACGFTSGTIQCGSFELGANRWVRAVK